METELQLAVGYIETFAGNGKARSTGDGKRAVKSGIPLPHHAALDKDEAWFYFAESGSDRIRRVNLREGLLHNFAGIGETCYSGDEGLCGEAGLYLPLDVAFDSHNDLYICDSGSNRIRKIDHETGIITTIIGTGQHGFNGDGPALETNLTWPAAIAFDPNDVMYIADTQAHRIRRYDPLTGMVTTVAGTWTAEDEAREQPLVARNLVVLKAIKAGIWTGTTKSELEILEAEKARLLAQQPTRSAPPAVEVLLPRLEEQFRAAVENLAQLHEGRIAEARQGLRLLLGGQPITLHPTADGGLEAEMTGDYAGMVRLVGIGRAHV